MEDERLAGVQTFHDLRLSGVALTELHQPGARASVVDGEHRPVVALSEETADGHS